MGIAYQLDCQLSGRLIVALEQLKPAYFEDLLLIGLPCILPIRGFSVRLPHETHPEHSVSCQVEFLAIFRLSAGHEPIRSVTVLWQEGYHDH